MVAATGDEWQGPAPYSLAERESRPFPVCDQGGRLVVEENTRMIHEHRRTARVLEPTCQLATVVHRQEPAFVGEDRAGPREHYSSPALSEVRVTRLTDKLENDVNQISSSICSGLSLRSRCSSRMRSQIS